MDNFGGCIAIKTKLEAYLFCEEEINVSNKIHETYFLFLSVIIFKINFLNDSN